VKKPIIELKDVWKTYKIGDTQVHALRGINLSVHKGEFLAILGPSGSGKSTAMNMVGCLDVPTKGTIYLDGHDISKLSESELAQIRGQKIGFIFQSFNLIDTLTALENVMLPMMFQSIPEHERKKRAEKLLAQFGLQERLHHRPTELSGGQQQRVAIARSLATDPLVILADEPTGNLDSKTGKEVMDFLKQLSKTGKTVVMVTHDLNLSKVAGRAEFLKDGQILSTKKNKRGKL